MKRKTAFSVLFIIVLASCTSIENRVPTQAIDLEDLEITAAMTYLAEDIDIGDGGLLSGLPCSSPCTFGIRIGETQLDQVIPVLEKNGVSRCWTEPNLSWSLISCGGNRLNVQVTMETSLVSAIWFDPSVLIALGDMIEKYGEPDYVTVDQEATRQLQLRLYWNSIRMSVLLPEMSGETYDVEKITEIEAIQFSDENLYRTSEKQTEPYYQPWNGYGMYQPTEPFPLNPTPIATATP
ncbi:MAG TPA: hypothetical protein VFY83_01540 [Anaerolineales bacterium]|nr:hypothetical protein [Anaerolineales bacterium]